MKACSEPGCDRPVKALGLCERHYKASRRQSGAKKGPPAKYPQDVRDRYGGAPVLSVRLEPDLMDWVQSQGGSAWLKRMLVAYKRVADDPARAKHWEEFERGE